MICLDKKILFAIVTYREKYWESKSFLTLVQSFKESGKELKELNIIIFDNTDIKDWHLELSINHSNINLSYFSDSSNPGISKAYNKINAFALKNNFEWIVFLDQDTSLPIEAYSKYQNKITNSQKSLVAVPIVYAGKKIISPSRFFLHRSILFKKVNANFLDFNNLRCINSGLIINTQFYDSIGGYNENLKLDFCDHDFIEKVKKKINLLEVLNIIFIQDFSSDNNTIEQSIFRYNIFLDDLNYYSLSRSKTALLFLIDIPHLIKLSYKYRSIKFFKIRFFKIRDEKF